MFRFCAGLHEFPTSKATKVALLPSNKEHSPRPCKVTGQRRELIIKQAEPVPRSVLLVDIAKIGQDLSKEEDELRAKAAEEEEKRKKFEEEMKNDAISKAVSGASAHLTGSLLDRMHGVAKLHAAAKSALGEELTEVKKAEYDALKASQTNTGHSPDGLKVSVPQARCVVIKVIHPCLVSKLRSKLSKNLAIPLGDVRIVHRSKVLGDKEHVPDDSVDVGEQDQVDDAGMGETLDLSYLWVVDARTLPQDAKATEVHGETAPAILGEPSQPSQSNEPTRNDESTVEYADDPATEERGDEETATTARTAAKSESLPPVDIAPCNGNQDNEARGDKMAIENVESEKDTTSAVLLEAGRMVDPNVSLEVPTTKAAADIPPGAGSDNNKNHDEPTKAKTAKKKFVPGSLLLTSLEASGLSDGLKGISSEQAPYLLFRWAGEEARTSVKRDCGRKCEWVEEELVLIAKKKNQLQEAVKLELWNDNSGHKSPHPDVLIGMGSFCVTRSEEVDPTSAITIEDTRRSLITGTGVESGKNAREVVTVNLTREDGGGTKGEPAGTVKLSVVFRPPRRKIPRATESPMLISPEDDHATAEKEDILDSLAGSAWWSQLNANNTSAQELGAAISKKLEGFDIREELRKIKYAQVLVDEGFGQRGAFANLQEDQLARHPVYMPRSARKRVLTLAELIRLQMKAEVGAKKTGLEVRDAGRAKQALQGLREKGCVAPVRSKEAIEVQMQQDGNKKASYTVDGKNFFGTMAAMNAFLEKKRRALEQADGEDTSDEHSKPCPKPPKPRSAAKQKVIQAIEEAAAARSRGEYSTLTFLRDKEKPVERKLCCEKHTIQVERSITNRVDEHIQNTVHKVDTWLDKADHFKNGAIPRNAVRTMLRDALVLNDLPSPRESDVDFFLERAHHDKDTEQFNRGKVALEIEKTVRKELCARARLPCSL